MVKKKGRKRVNVRSDVSKKTVAILLVVAVVLSVIATWLVMSGTGSSYNDDMKEPTGVGKASLEIIGQEGSAQTEGEATASINIKPNTEE